MYPSAQPPGGGSHRVLTASPFFNYNFAGGWFASSAPIITADWHARGAKWILPVGAAFGRVIKLGGRLPLVLQIGAYCNVLRPSLAPTWQLRTQVAVVF